MDRKDCFFKTFFEIKTILYYQQDLRVVTIRKECTVLK